MDDLDFDDLELDDDEEEEHDDEEEALPPLCRVGVCKQQKYVLVDY